LSTGSPANSGRAHVRSAGSAPGDKINPAVMAELVPAGA